MSTPHSPKTEKLLFSALRVKCLLHKMASRARRGNHSVYVWDRIRFYKQMWETAASKLDARLTELAEGIWEVSLGRSRTYINIHKVQLDDAVISSIAGNKPFCYDVLRKAHIPVPNHVTFRTDALDKPWRFLNQKKGFYVVKPALDTGSGMGVTTHVRSWPECRNAVALASLYSSSVILEELVPGECYRMLVLNGKMIHAVRRRGVRIRGDGRSAIGELIEKENKLRREEKVRNARRTITRNRDMAATLFVQGLSHDSVLAKGRTVLIQSYDCHAARHVEVRTIYNEVVTDVIGKKLRQQVERTACLLHSKFVGVDVITLDPSVSLEKSGGVINEINTNPGLHHHYVASTHDQYHSEDDINPTVHVLSFLLDGNGRAESGMADNRVES